MHNENMVLIDEMPTHSNDTLTVCSGMNKVGNLAETVGRVPGWPSG